MARPPEIKYDMTINEVVTQENPCRRSNEDASDDFWVARRRGVHPGIVFVLLTAAMVLFCFLFPKTQIYQDVREVSVWSQYTDERHSLERSLARLWPAIMVVESGGDLNAVGRDGELGPLQIRPIMVREVNRIARQTHPSLGATVPFSNEDRTDLASSILMFEIYSRYWCMRTDDYSAEGIARRWNGGPTGHLKDATLPYWKKVKAQLK